MTKGMERSGTLEIPGMQYPYISEQLNQCTFESTVTA